MSFFFFRLDLDLELLKKKQLMLMMTKMMKRKRYDERFELTVSTRRKGTEVINKPFYHNISTANKTSVSICLGLNSRQIDFG